jgi:hypothetical protein
MIVTPGITFSVFGQRVEKSIHRAVPVDICGIAEELRK